MASATSTADGLVDSVRENLWGERDREGIADATGTERGQTTVKDRGSKSEI